MCRHGRGMLTPSESHRLTSSPYRLVPRFGFQPRFLAPRHKRLKREPTRWIEPRLSCDDTCWWLNSHHFGSGGVQYCGSDLFPSFCCFGGYGWPAAVDGARASPHDRARARFSPRAPILICFESRMLDCTCVFWRLGWSQTT